MLKMQYLTANFVKQEKQDESRENGRIRDYLYLEEREQHQGKENYEERERESKMECWKIVVDISRSLNNAKTH